MQRFLPCVCMGFGQCVKDSRQTIDQKSNSSELEAPEAACAGTQTTARAPFDGIETKLILVMVNTLLFWLYFRKACVVWFHRFQFTKLDICDVPITKRDHGIRRQEMYVAKQECCNWLYSQVKRLQWVTVCVFIKDYFDLFPKEMFCVQNVSESFEVYVAEMKC